MYSDLHLELIFVHSDVYRDLTKVGEKLTKQALSQLIHLDIIFCVTEKSHTKKPLTVGQPFLTIRQSERIVHRKGHYKN